jgi:hypothetical protein
VIVSDARLLDQVRDPGANGATNGAPGPSGPPTNGAPSLLRVRVNRNAMDTTTINQLHELFVSRPGRCRIAFELVQDDGSEATIDAGSAVRADRELVERVREICGSDSVAVVQ